VTPLRIGVAVLTLAAAAYLALLLRATIWLGDDPQARRRRRTLVLVSFAAGAALGPCAVAFESWFSGVTGLTATAQKANDWTSILAMLLFFAPAEEILKAGVTWWLVRSRWFRDTLDGLVCASTVAMAFGCVESASHLRQLPITDLSALRALLAVPSHVFCAGIWGFALGRARIKRRRLGAIFAVAWLGATLVRGLYEHLVFAEGSAALLSAMPLLGGMAAVAYLAYRDLRDAARGRMSPPPSRSARSSSPSSRHRRIFLPSLPPPPSLLAMRAALRRAERPVGLHWIVIGALVTTGVTLVSAVVTIVLAKKLGVDFGAVDEGAVTSTVPLALLGGAVLVAFPIAGFLVARASATDSVLEPALSAGLSIVGAFVMLGMAAPVALVFALAFAPFAFGLACVGAWVGIGGSH
jgi:RsiW-degrading membrane proteinase PrsW (M82 family)